MLPLTLLTALALLVAEGESTPDTFERRLHEVNLSQAKLWSMHLDEDHKTTAELVEKPVYHWTNPTKGGGQYGSVFVWVHEGRPLVVASIFAHPTEGKRRLVHEFHSLVPKVFYPHCDDEDPETWQPTGGITLQELGDVAPPAATPARRLLQMRTLGREFGGHTVDWRKQRWELRLLPRPLFRYEQPKGDVVDGALFALVTDAGTDPEILLLLEATKDSWRYALLRFTDSSYFVRRGEKEVFSAERGTPEWAQHNNPDHTYRTFRKRFLTEAEIGGAEKIDTAQER